MNQEIERRRTFAIISHPDAGKTTLTEKLLLFGGQIQVAGAVKSNKIKKTATSDWMEIEKQRGISVTTSVMEFDYTPDSPSLSVSDGNAVAPEYKVNILDTPGHQDFSEDTYRTLMAADSAVMVIDGSKGVEAQTKKLFKVCTMRHIPIFTFINKMDRDALDTFDLLDDIETNLGIDTCPVNWPIGSGKDFRGIYDRTSKNIIQYADTLKGTKEGTETDIPMSDKDAVIANIGEGAYEKLTEETELLDGAAVPFDLDAVQKGKLTPVFFGSALQNFGVEIFLKAFLQMALPPTPRMSDKGEIDPVKNRFSAFVFKIQANMNKAHRDRVAFMRICSGKYEAGMEVRHVQSGRIQRLSQPQQLMAEERKVLTEAYAGDIMGVFDPGIYSIGDTICMPDEEFRYEGIPTFAPEHFARVRQVDTMKRDQFVKGIRQIAQEGAIQVFQEYNTGMEEIIAGVVGVLQFDVLKFRLKSEYNVDINLEMLPYEHIRWIARYDGDVKHITGTTDMKLVKDMKERPLLLFVNPWSPQMVLDRNKGLVLEEFSKN